ncbi:MmgE/PrpD family protein [Halomarina halobia]|uniref:MmgE/PrpD family protein n=1 Tax=Halomarina halobia TaxID=3033386 RepID=A0ABD6ADD1_9EURY|nr:MmgE/PrpD family protein [Halomarina sp. PSR21]
MTDLQPVREWEAQAYEFIERPVPAEVRARGAKTVSDVLCAMVAGADEPTNREVATTAPLADGPATVVGTDRRVAPGHAALVNGASAITPEIEEGHNTGGHVGAGIVAGGLAAAEAADRSGREFVEACVRSYELCVRLEFAIFAMKARLNEAVPWLLRDPHSTWTTVGPALTAAQCLGHASEELRETFRVAANLAVVSMHDPFEEGAPARNFTAGFSAQAGVDAAVLAGAGLSGSATAVAEVYDPFEELLDEGVFARQFAELGETWEITRNYFKPYPSCRYTHPPLDALRAAGEIDPAEVESVDVHTFANAAEMDAARPTTLTGAKFSTPYVLARYLHSGAVELADFEPERVVDPAVQSLAERVTLHVDEAFEAAFPEDWGARVRVTLASGEVRTGERAYPRGDYRDPLSEEEFRDRCRRLLDPLDDPEAALDAVLAVDERPVRDVTAALRTA